MLHFQELLSGFSNQVTRKGHLSALKLGKHTTGGILVFFLGSAERRLFLTRFFRLGGKACRVVHVDILLFSSCRGRVLILLPVLWSAGVLHCGVSRLSIFGLRPGFVIMGVCECFLWDAFLGFLSWSFFGGRNWTALGCTALNIRIYSRWRAICGVYRKVVSG